MRVVIQGCDSSKVVTVVRLWCITDWLTVINKINDAAGKDKIEFRYTVFAGV